MCTLRSPLHNYYLKSDLVAHCGFNFGEQTTGRDAGAGQPETEILAPEAAHRLYPQIACQVRE